MKIQLFSRPGKIYLPGRFETICCLGKNLRENMRKERSDSFDGANHIELYSAEPSSIEEFSRQEIFRGYEGD